MGLQKKLHHHASWSPWVTAARAVHAATGTATQQQKVAPIEDTTDTSTQPSRSSTHLHANKTVQTATVNEPAYAQGGQPNLLLSLGTRVGGINSEEDNKRSQAAMQQHIRSIPLDSQGKPLYQSSIELPPDFDPSETSLPHPIWSNEYVNKVCITHKTPADRTDRLAEGVIKVIRFNFDWMSGWSFGRINQRKALHRIIFLESVAGVPGSVAAVLRHLSSLRRFKRDHGWISTLLEEAENERNHLLTYLQKGNPGPFMRLMVWISQGVFFNFFWFAYLIHPRFCHSMVGYLEEEAVKTYTKVLQEIDAPHGGLHHWKRELAPPHAMKYWKLPRNATMRDVILATRADESHHRDVNHAFASLKPDDANPFRPGL